MVKKILITLKKYGIKGLLKKTYLYFNDEDKKEYYKWIKVNTPTKRELSNQRKYVFNNNPKISIIVPLYNTPKKYLLELIKSVQNQTYTNWELCLADGSTMPLDFLNKIVEKDSRIKYQKLKENKGISGNTNEALKIATGDFISLLDHDDLIPVNSLYEIVKAINENKDVEFLFTDEDKFTDINKKTRYEPNFKPDYAFDTFTSYNYICHFSIFKKELIDKLVGFNNEFDGSQDYDLILRAVEHAGKIVHIPKILYHWRVHKNSTAGNAEAKPYCFDAGKRAVQKHLERKEYKGAKAEYGIAIVRNRVVYPVQKNQKVKIILYLQDERIDLEKLNQDIEKITYSNFDITILTSRDINNYQIINKNAKVSEIIKISDNNLILEINNVVSKTNAEQIIIAKDIQDIKTENFIEQLIGFVQREEVGVVSPRIIYKFQSTQYNGTIYGIDSNNIGYLDYIDVAGSFGYVTRGAVVQNFSIIKSECIMVSKENLLKVNGLNTSMDFSDSLADVSFSLFKRFNKLNVINPHIELETLEKTLKNGENKFFQKWENELKIPDPNYNVNLRFEENKLFKIKQEKVG